MQKLVLAMGPTAPLNSSRKSKDSHLYIQLGRITAGIYEKENYIKTFIIIYTEITCLQCLLTLLANYCFETVVN